MTIYLYILPNPPTQNVHRTTQHSTVIFPATEPSWHKPHLKYLSLLDQFHSLIMVLRTATRQQRSPHWYLFFNLCHECILLLDLCFSHLQVFIMHVPLHMRTIASALHCLRNTTWLPPLCGNMAICSVNLLFPASKHMQIHRLMCAWATTFCVTTACKLFQTVPFLRGYNKKQILESLSGVWPNDSAKAWGINEDLCHLEVFWNCLSLTALLHVTCRASWSQALNQHLRLYSPRFTFT